MAALGVKAVLERVDISQYIERRRSGDFDIVSHSFSMGFEPGIGLEQWFALQDRRRQLAQPDAAAATRRSTG